MREGMMRLIFGSSACFLTAHAFISKPCLVTPRASWFASAPSTSVLKAAVPSVVVVSPPGGVGEVAAVKSASMGSSVRWFVVCNEEATQQAVVLSSQSLETIANAGGMVQLAGASAASLLLPTDDPNSSLPAVSAWCGEADAILCTFDGIDEAMTTKTSRNRNSDIDEGSDPKTTWRNAIKVAAREASAAIRGRKVAILSATEDEGLPSKTEPDKGLGVSEFVGNIFGGKRPSIPDTLTGAMSVDDASVIKLRHGVLFGTPESSPEFSTLVGGPKRVPELCEEYTMRSVRVDPTLSVTGNLMMGKNTRSSRHAVGEAAALMALGEIPIERDGLDVCVSSQRGYDPVPIELWNEEFRRVQTMLSSSGGGAPQLFSAEFSSVPDVKRLTDWLATKWAPAILRTYDIAAIRVGARPVYATRTDENVVEVVWQQLVDFNSVTVGKMVIEVSETGLVATRGPGDASKGFGTVSRQPLGGEDVLVRRLAEAASQAIEKGLANKPLPAKPAEAIRVTTTPVPVTSIQDSGTVATAVVLAPTTTVAPAIDEAAAAAASRSDQGPRKTGARRSTERKRGKRRIDERQP